MGEWVIKTALAQISDWKAQGLGLHVSVNIDAQHLQHDGFALQLARLLSAQSDVLPQNLRLEVLESSALGDIDRVSAAMQSCLALGLDFSLDDFGTGYSSLTYLRRLPAHTFKIDQSFVKNMLDDADDLAIVKGVIGLAQAFERTVIAEGVETRAHGDALLGIGCDLAQGYCIARPMPASEIPAWVASWHSDPRWTA
jgi:EAL domain-containing protein (putative c-di-GMP-specific phosphodiesterase class I)